MKQAVLYVCHGSRVKKACEEAIAFLSRCQKHVEAEIQEVCFLELASPSIEEGFSSCVQQGATHIAVVPLLLLTAVHAKYDIPLELEKVSRQHPGVQVTYGKPIGVHEKMAESVVERVLEQNERYPDSSVIVLIGRGSSDPDVVKDLESIGELVKKHSHIEDVRICYLVAAKPKFEDMLAKLTLLKNRSIFLVPYLLFTGVLMKKIESQVQLAQEENNNIRLCRYLGYDSKVEEVFTERVLEAMRNTDSSYTFNGQYKGIME
ncbi:sirohydrochlorin chelatase [Peribacillus asahii]|uniref:sirohydrochlorin chelatase n=1 Tax=Peribacillus asahii TaxID=228899 RepID=UPI0037FDF163